MKSIGLTILVIITYFTSRSQDNHIYGEIGIGGNVTTGNRVPFWMRANQFGNSPVAGKSGSFYGAFHKYYDTATSPLFDWGGGLEVRGDMTHSSKGGTLVEGYLKGAFSIFEIKAGRTRDVTGIMDSTLSSGSFSVSGNAPGIPQVKISIPEFYSIPSLDGLLAFKGSFSLGWTGHDFTSSKEFPQVYNTYFHQKTFYLRLGRPDWRVRFTGGFNHQVLFGGEQYLFGPNYDMGFLKKFLYVTVDKKLGSHHIGNSLGSVDVSAEIEGNSVRMLIYRQTFYDGNALIHLKNLKDGLNGVSITNLNEGDGPVYWHKALLELLYTNNQGYPMPGRGYENYYNDTNYVAGWAYKGAGIGNPLLSNSLYMRDTAIAGNRERFINNRVIAIHAGLEGGIYGFVLQGKLTYSKNYGTFDPGQTRIAGVSQVSGFLAISHAIPRNMIFSGALAFDYGHLLYNTAGVSVKIAKLF